MSEASDYEIIPINENIPFSDCNYLLYCQKNVLSNIRSITPGKPPRALIEIVYILIGILPPYKDIIISEAIRAEIPVSRLITIFPGDIRHSINITITIADMIRLV